MEKRKVLRFPVALKVGLKKENKERVEGVIKNFSRHGLKIIFSEFNFEPGSSVELKIQRPERDTFVPGTGRVAWKKFVDDGFEVGIELIDFPPQVKAEILDYCYTNWVKNLPSQI
jgi:hypothetical protein